MWMEWEGVMLVYEDFKQLRGDLQLIRTAGREPVICRLGMLVRRYAIPGTKVCNHRFPDAEELVSLTLVQPALDGLKHRYVLTSMVELGIGRDGALVGGRFDEGSPMTYGLALGGNPIDASHRTLDVAAAHMRTGAFLYAMNFLHCKNATVEAIDPSPKQARLAREKRLLPPTRYHVIRVGGAPRAGHSPVVDAGGDLMPLHICRGHFKVFTHERPLLGRHVGTYWWASHARGTPRRGVVESRYSVGDT